MRFIHTADIHLDSPLAGLAAYPDAPAATLRSASRDAFEALVGRAIALAVDFMLIAGDLYDGSWRDANTGIFFVRQMGRLKAAGIPCYVVFGNHDAESEMTSSLLLPDNVHCFATDRAESVALQLPGQRVLLHGRSFRQRDTTDNLARSYPAAQPGCFNIGLLHTALEGNAQHASYAPCTVAELHALDYQYWALGHVHEHRVLWSGGAPGQGAVVAFPGNLQGRHVRETGPRGALLVEVDDGGSVRSVERLHTDVLRWQLLQVDAGAARTLADVARACGQALATLLAQEGSGLPLAVRLVVDGASAAHGALFAAEGALRDEVIAQAVALEAQRLWIEQVRVQTRPLDQAAGPASAAERGDALAQLQALLAEATQDEALMQALADDIGALSGRLPRALTDSVPALVQLREGGLAAWVDAVRPSVIAHVAQAD